MSEDSLCLDCGVDTFEAYYDYYMVHDHIWKQTGLGGDDGMLCLECLELRIGRKLKRTDFIYAPVNDDPAKMYPLEFTGPTALLQDRIARTKLYITIHESATLGSLSGVNNITVTRNIPPALMRRLYKAAWFIHPSTGETYTFG